MRLRTPKSPTTPSTLTPLVRPTSAPSRESTRVFVHDQPAARSAVAVTARGCRRGGGGARSSSRGERHAEADRRRRVRSHGRAAQHDQVRRLCRERLPVRPGAVATLTGHRVLAESLQRRHSIRTRVTLATRRTHPTRSQSHLNGLNAFLQRAYLHHRSAKAQVPRTSLPE